MKFSFSIFILGAISILPVVGDEPITLHDFHPFRPVNDISDWDERKKEIQIRTQLAAGLYPLPERTPLKAKRYGVVERDGFRVERVYFESFPGHYVTGSLFLPAGESEKIGLIDGKRPAFLCPHGHWKDGRFYDAKEAAGERGVLQQIAQGGERFETNARNPIISRCVQLARMGCIAFAYDMLGNADSMQLKEHRRGPRESMNSAELGKWGFISPQATLRLQTNFGLQTWNSIRALDFLAELDGVDPDRLGVTGASGGGTQTMVIAAIDDRIDASFPCVMPSTAMQGGCTCENSHYLRIEQGNMDITAALAPKPLGLTAADDWTIELETKGHPDLLDLYKRLGASKNYEAHFDIHFKHNYNHVSRTHMYQFVNRHFELGLDTPALESDYEYLGPEELSVWAEPGKKPDHYLEGDEHEREVNRIWAEDSARSWARASENGKPGELNEESEWVAEAWKTILRPEIMTGPAPVFELRDKVKENSVVTMTGVISYEKDDVANELRMHDSGEVLPAKIYYPEEWNGEVVIQLGEQGLEEPVELGGATVICLELAGLGRREEANVQTTYSGKDDIPEDSWQHSPVYYYGYNDSLFVRRTHEIVAAVLMAKHHPDWEVESVSVRGDGGYLALALASSLIAGPEVDEVIGEVGDFRFDRIDSLWDDFMVPGAVKYGGVEGLRLTGISVVKE